MEDKLRIAVEIHQIRITMACVMDHKDSKEYIRKTIRVRRLPDVPQIGIQLDTIVDEVLA